MLLLVRPVHAAAPSSYLGIDQGVDSNDGRDSTITLDLGLGSMQLGLVYGESEIRMDTVVNNPSLPAPIIVTTTMETETREVSIGNDPLKDFAFRWTYTEWGQAEAMEIMTHRLDLTFNTDNWRFTLAPELRKIDLHCSVQTQYITPLLQLLFPNLLNNLEQICRDNPVVEMESEGINLGVAYYGFEPWYFSIDYSHYNYSRNIDLLASAPEQTWWIYLIFPPFTMNQTFGLEEERIAGDIGYAFARASLGISGSQSVSAVDESVSTSWSLYLSYQLTSAWTLSLEGGFSDHSLSSETTHFGTLGLGYSW